MATAVASIFAAQATTAATTAAVSGAATGATVLGPGAYFGSTAAEATAAGPSLFSFANILNGVGTLFSMAQSITAGNREAAALSVQARNAELQAMQEEVKGKQQAANIREQLAAAVAARVAAHGAGSVDISSGSPALDITSRTIKGGQMIDQARSNATIASEGAKADAASKRVAAYYARAGGRAKATGTLLKFASGIYNQAA